jgi:signal transduction histidine kinase/ketosteroid isomerase-like protein
MKVTPALKKELAQWLETYWTTYLKGDIKTWATFLRDDYRNIGGTKEEIWNSKQEIIDYTNSILDQMQGTVEFRNQEVELIPYGEYMMVHEFTDIYVKAEGEWTLYSPFRMSSLLEKTDTGWIAMHQHGSYPDMKAMEGEAFSMDAVKAENAKLLEAVKSRTLQLEIEAALERVRAVAMGMKKPEDMLDVCRIISDQLQQFGVDKIRNVQIAIIDENIGQYLCYQYFTPYDKSTVEKTEYLKSPVEHGMVKQMLASRDGYFIGRLSGKELEDFRVHRKEENHFPDPFLDKATELVYCFLSIGEGGLGLTLYQPMTADVLTLFKRFHQVFSLAFRRFQDIQKAEAQAREAQIEVAVERVRAQSMAMHHPDDLDKVNKEILTQLNSLQIQGLSGVTFYLVDQDGWVKAWDFSSPGNIGNQKSYTLQFDFKKYEMMGYPFKIFQQTDLNYLVADYPLEKLERAVYEIEEINPEVATVVKEALAKGILTHQWSACARISDGILGIDLVSPPSEDTKTIVLKIAGAFNQAYQRFLDLQKAEAQAREAQIEVALERTRTHSMLMQHSDEIKSISNIFHEQLLLLDIPSEFSYVWLPDEANQSHQFWASWSDKNEGGTTLQSKQVTYPLDKSEPYTAACFAAWANPDVILQEFIPPSDIAGFFEVWQELLAGATKLKADFFPQGIYYSEAYMRYGCFGINIRRKLSEEEKNILKRFSIEFERAYTRFLDLQKAESQAREAQIQLALERVRARTMAMQSSEELAEVSYLLNRQVVELGIPTRGCAFNIYNEHDSTEWFSDLEGTLPPYPTPREYIFKKYYEAGQRGESLLVDEFSGDRIKELYQYFASRNNFENEAIDNHLAKAPEYQINYMAYFKYGYLLFITLIPAPEAHDIFKRFAKEFEQTYTRFLDLKKAEAQAREAQIEAALEKVRSRTMAMQSSNELADAAYVLFEQLNILGVTHERINIGIVDEENNCIDFWVTEQGGQKLQSKFSGRISEPTTLSKSYEAWKRGSKSLVVDLQGEDLQSWLRYMEEEIKIPFNKAYLHNRRVQTAGFFSKGMLVVTSPEPLQDEAVYLLEKFAKVFDLTYTRFNDLLLAEAQAKEAQIELSLEKIRAQVASMQESTDLLDIMVNIRSEFVALGHEANYFWYMRWLPEKYEKAMTSGDGTQVGMVMNLPRHMHGDIPLVANWELGEEPTLVFPMEVDTAVAYIDKMITLGDFIQIDPKAPTLDDIRHIGGLTFVMARTSQGEIGYSLPGYVPNPSLEAVGTLARFAGVFDLAYKRFEDLKKAEKDLVEIKEAKKKAEEALVELKATQSQLVQQEKLASLGQLTAGIAHEIKNPLNFVNNFSEVSIEMIEEIRESRLKTQDTRHKTEADEIEDEILEDIKANLKKIHEHGSRANGIVTSMLQHSRGGSGKMEPTDLNGLIKEYVNLSFHGMRAGKNPINVDIILDLDPEVKEVSLIKEDFTRVVINLCNNAFDAMREKVLKTEDRRRKTEDGNSENTKYDPKLKVITSLEKGQVRIAFEDNGPGIPDEIKDKILQPFFTTKKGTEGTGLGLSITHDIVKAHGGELKVESTVGKRTEFTIKLPVNPS